MAVVSALNSIESCICKNLSKPTGCVLENVKGILSLDSGFQGHSKNVVRYSKQMQSVASVSKHGYKT